MFFMEKCGQFSLNYPCYPFLSGALYTSMFSTIFTHENNFSGFLFASQDRKAFPKWTGSTLKGKNLLLPLTIEFC